MESLSPISMKSAKIVKNVQFIRETSESPEERKTNEPARVPIKSEPTNSLFLIKQKSLKKDEDGENLEAVKDAAFLMKYNFVPANVKILNIFMTSTATFLQTTSGKLYSWGTNNPVLGRKCFSEEQARSPEEIKIISRVLTLATGKDHCLALDFDGKIYGWGDNSRGQLGISANKYKKNVITLDIPTLIPSFEGMKISAIFAGENVSYALTEKGLLYGWGENIYGQINSSDQEFTPIPQLFSKMPWMNEEKTVIRIGRTHHRYVFLNPDQKDNKVNFNNEGMDLMKIIRLEMKINDLNGQITKLENVNKEFEEKLYGKNSNRINEVHRNFDEDDIISEMNQQITTIQQSTNDLSKKIREISHEVENLENEVREVKSQMEVLLEKENEMAETFDQIDQKIRKIKFSKETDPNYLAKLENKRSRILETIKINNNLKTSISKKLSEYEELKKNRTEMKKNSIREMEELNKKVSLYEKLKIERKAVIVRRFFGGSDEHFFTVFNKFYALLAVLKDTKINEIARKQGKNRGIFELVRESNEMLDEAKRKIEHVRTIADDVAFEFSNKMLEIFDDNINLRKTINEFSMAILLHTNNKIEEFYKENKFVAINSDGTMKKIEEKVCIEKKKKRKKKIMNNEPTNEVTTTDSNI